MDRERPLLTIGIALIPVNTDAGANLSLSARIESGLPIIAERPMYFDFHGWTGGHDVVGFAPQ